MTNRRPVRMMILAGFLILLVGVSGCGQSTAEHFAVSGPTMGTTYHIKIAQTLDDAVARQLKSNIDQLLVDVNQHLSTYQADSELSKFNQSQSLEPVAVSKGLYRVVTAAQSISAATGGAFDVTVGPLVNLWGFGPEFKPDQVPTESDIAAAKARIGYRNITRLSDPDRIQKAIPELYIDLSAIAKGYGVDQVAELIESKGYKNYLVEIGGEVRCQGKNSSGQAWQVAIEKPLAGERRVQKIVPIVNMAVATSGNYRNFFELDGVHYAHTIDPATGWPVSHDLASVTVLHQSSMISDGWATAFMVLGAEKGYDLAVEENLAVLFLRRTENGIQEHMTPAFESYMNQSAP